MAGKVDGQHSVQNGDLEQSESSVSGLPKQIPGEEPIDPENFDQIHPLQHRWTLWYDRSGGPMTSAQNWGDNLKKIYTFGTVEDFWRLYNNVKRASLLSNNSNYHLFKEGIEPKWEDEANSQGGKWVIILSSKKRDSDLDRLWLWAILGVIGESFEGCNDICGIVVSIRKSGDKISIWTKDSSPEATKSIGENLKSMMELNQVIGFQTHADAAIRKSTAKYNV